MSSLSILLTAAGGRDEHSNRSDERTYYDYFTETDNAGNVTRRIVIAWNRLGEREVRYGACIYRKEGNIKGGWNKKSHRETALRRLQSVPVTQETKEVVNPRSNGFRAELRSLLHSHGVSSTRERSSI